MGGAGRRRPDSGLPMRGRSAVFDLPEIGVLAEQSGASAHQAGCDVAAAGVRVPVDAPRYQWRLELGAAAWHHLPAGLLGAHRVGLRPLAMVLQERPDGAGGHADSPLGDSVYGGDLDPQDLPRAGSDDVVGDGLVVHTETRARAGRLGCVGQPILAAAGFQPATAALMT